MLGVVFGRGNDHSSFAEQRRSARGGRLIDGRNIHGWIRFAVNFEFAAAKQQLAAVLLEGDRQWLPIERNQTSVIRFGRGACGGGRRWRKQIFAKNRELAVRQFLIGQGQGRTIAGRRFVQPQAPIGVGGHRGRTRRRAEQIGGRLP